MSQEETPPNFFKKAMQFFRDESIPMGARVGVAGGIAIVLTFPLWADLGGSSRSNQIISEIDFPTGPSGLAESDPQADLARAQANQLLAEQEAKVVQKTQATKNMLAAVDPAEQTQSNQQATTSAVTNSTTSAKETGVDLPETRVVKEQAQSPVSASQTKAAVEPESAFKQLPIPLRVARGIFEGTDKTVYLAYRQGILSFKDGKLGNAKTILSNKIYDAGYNADIPELSSIGIGKDGALFAGFSDGQLMKYQRYEWNMLATGSRGTQSTIHSILGKDNELFVGSKGLYQWDDSLKQFFSNPDHRSGRVRAIAKSPSGRIFMGTNRAIWRYKNDSEDAWEIVWKAPKSDSAIHVISAKSDSSLAIGTTNGLVRVSTSGVVLDRALENENVQSIIEKKDGTMWAGSRGSGLRYFDGIRWYHANREQGLGNWVTQLLLDSRDRLWVGATGVGIFIANEFKAVEWIKQFPDESARATEPQIFSDACEAADSLLKDVALSNQIANRPFDGRGYVFLNGVQACPKGVGSYKPDGTAVLLKGWNVLIFRDNKRVEKIIPKEVPADRAQIVFLDSQNRIWISIKDGELYVSNGDKFDKIDTVEMLNNPVTAITEDLHGNLWFGSTPSYDQKAETYHHKNLHKLNGRLWTHYDSRDGLIQNSTLSMARGDKSGIVIGTRSGISVLDDKGMVTNYGGEQGLEPAHIAAVNLDGKNRVWFSHLFHGDGIGWISNGTINRVSTKEGFFNPKIGRLAIDRYGKIWAEASNGKVGVYPQSFLEKHKTSTAVPEKTLREIELGNQ